VGKAALEGLPGIKQVTRGWHNFREINTVTYDTGIVTPDDMIAALKRAGTFRGVVE
jgi:copper chaperone CopZ